MLQRFCKLPETNSFFLFGPRATGKSTLLSQKFASEQSLVFDLLNPIQFEKYSARPQEFAEYLVSAGENVSKIIVDEVQRVPLLLDIVQQFMTSKRFQFALTGSSARKLKRGAANLLGGRAIVKHLGPLSALEILNSKGNEQAGFLKSAVYENLTNNLIQFGALPLIFNESNLETKILLLRSYAQTYLNEEVVAEQLVRNLAPFRKFLHVAAMANGKTLNAQKLSQNVGCSHVTIQNYYEILEDTLIGFSLPCFHTSVRKRLRTKPKFYFFDIGVWRALARNLEVEIQPSTSLFGEVFEHLVICEIKTLAAYFKPDWLLTYLQTQSGTEIDLVVDTGVSEPILIEIKSTENTQKIDFTATYSLMLEFPKSKKFVFSRDPLERIDTEGVNFIHWIDGLKKLFSIV